MLYLDFDSKNEQIIIFTRNACFLNDFVIPIANTITNIVDNKLINIINIILLCLFMYLPSSMTK